MLTGNYNFFNLITIGLCITSLDDSQLPTAGTLVSYISPVSNGGLGAIAAIFKLPFKIIKSIFKLPYRMLTGSFKFPLRFVFQLV